ncbi:MAG: hypothetical protein PHH83_03020 [Patescibacteria group bacterium]|nr:hypothetical protein [Patescibacteria group bacterium]
MDASITEGQKKQYLRFVEDTAILVLDESNLDKDAIQRLIENGGQLKKDLAILLQKHSITNQYADEELKSNYGYLSGYKPKSLAEQDTILHQLFPELGTFDEAFATKTPLSNAEGLFLIPRWEKIAPTYGEAVQKVLDLIKQTRNGAFYNYREGQLGPRYLRQSQKLTEAFQKLGDEQKDHDVLVVQAQFGIRHRGRSVRRAREVMNSSESGLGSFANGIMILTHPERLQHYDDLWIDCAGDEYAPDGDDDFSKAPYFRFDGGWVGFDAGCVSNAYEDYGSSSLFLSQ